jgi:hypothetical protein
MKVEYICPVTKIISGVIEIPDDTKEEEKLDLCKAIIAKQLAPLNKQGFFVLEDEIQFNDTEYIQSSGDELSSKNS